MPSKTISKPIKIKPTLEELEQIINLYIECFNDEEKSENWTLESAGKYFEDRINEGSIFYVIKDEDKIVATIMGSDFGKSFLSKEINIDIPESFYIALIAASPSYRGQGLSSQIMSFLESDLSYSSYVARCRAENTPVQALFKKYKYQELMRYKSELGGVICERLILHKRVVAQ